MAALQGLLLLTTGGAAAATPEWTTYRQNAQRGGADPDGTSPVSPTQLWQTGTLDGDIYGEPLIYGPDVYVATENDTIYSLNAATGAIAWEAHVGTAIPSEGAHNQLSCGDIQPTVGITGTPVIDPATRTIYAVADVWDGTHAASVHHELVALNLENGAMRTGFPINVDPSFPAGGKAANQLQRPGLALDGNQVIIGYGGNDGDCSTYWGWLVAAPESGSGPLLSYQVDSAPGEEAGAIWGGGNAPPIDQDANIYAATGNGKSQSQPDAETEYDYGDSVLKLNPAMQLQGSWAPADWKELDEEDLDLGSSAPVLLPDELLFEIGKQGIGVLLHTNALGGLGAKPAAELSICPSWGGGIYAASSATTGTLYVNCDNGVRAILLSGLDTATPQMSLSPSWTVDTRAVGPPILAGGLVWVASWGGASGYLFGLNPSTGEMEFESNLGGFVHFSTPSAAGGRLFAADGDHVTGLSIDQAPAPTATSTALGTSANPGLVGGPVTFTATVSPVPYSGTVAFTNDGVTVSGCEAVSVSYSTGHASCQTSFGRGSAHTIAATYSGDAYYLGSASSLLDQQLVEVGPLLALSRPEVSSLRQTHRLWREGRRAAVVSDARALTTRHRLPVGTTFTFSLNRAGRVTLRFLRRLTGRKVAGTCHAKTKRNSARRHCELAVGAGTLSFTAGPGTRHVSFQGVLPHSKRLPPGRYRLIVKAVNSSGSSAPVSLFFTIAA